MRLRELIKSAVREKEYKQKDLARKLRKSPQSVSMTLARPINRCTFRIVQEYCTALGIKCDFKKMICNQN